MPFLKFAVVIPVLAGGSVGWLIRRRPTLAAFCGIMAVILLSMTYVDGADVSGVLYRGSANLLFVEYVFWLPIGCAAAGLGGWLRNRTHPVSGLARE